MVVNNHCDPSQISKTYRGIHNLENREDQVLSVFKHTSMKKDKLDRRGTLWNLIQRKESSKHLSFKNWWRGGLMVSTLDFGSSGSGPGPGPAREHCVVYLGKTLYSHSASLHPGVQMGTGEFNAWGSRLLTLRWTCSNSESDK